MRLGIKIKNVFFSYSQDKYALEDISYNIKKGTFLGVAGRNGSGKSTFSYLLNGLIPHCINGKFDGEVFVDSVSTRTKNIAFFSRKVGMVFQNPDFSLFNLTVAEEVEFGLKNFGIDLNRKNIEKILDMVQMSDFIDCDPQTLSFGQKQKVSLACSLALNTEYFVLDEPVAQLDFESSQDFYKILNNLNKQGKTIIVIEHDSDFLAKYAEEILILDSGKISMSGEPRKILSDGRFMKKIGLKTISDIS